MEVRCGKLSRHEAEKPIFPNALSAPSQMASRKYLFRRDLRGAADANLFLRRMPAKTVRLLEIDPPSHPNSLVIAFRFSVASRLGKMSADASRIPGPAGIHRAASRTFELLPMALVHVLPQLDAR